MKTSITRTKRHQLVPRFLLLAALVVSLVALSLRLQAQTGCNASYGLPFTDLGNMASGFCQAVAEAYFSGLTSGTTATTYSPEANVTRDQMAAFVTRTLDQSLKRGSRRAAHNQWWTPGSGAVLDLSATPTEAGPGGVASDGADIWVIAYVPGPGDGKLMRVRASDGKVLQTWSSFYFDGYAAPLVAAGRVFAGFGCCCGGGAISMIDPRSTAGPVTVAYLNGWPESLAFDGAKIWTANRPNPFCGVYSVSYVPVDATPPWTATTLTAGFSQPFGILYDGSHIWVTDRGDDRLKKVNKADGTVLQSIPVGTDPGHPVFDGTNIWVPNYGSDNITVVRVKDATGNPLSSAFVLKTLTAPFMLGPFTAAFDGARVLVACQTQGIYLFKAADLSFITGISTAPDTVPYGACSDGLNFFVTLNGANKLVRY